MTRPVDHPHEAKPNTTKLEDEEPHDVTWVWRVIDGKQMICKEQEVQQGVIHVSD